MCTRIYFVTRRVTFWDINDVCLKIPLKSKREAVFEASCEMFNSLFDGNDVFQMKNLNVYELQNFFAWILVGFSLRSNKRP